MRLCGALVLLGCLGLVSCATVRPAPEVIDQKVATLLGTAPSPGNPQTRVVAEPTGLRWTIYRGQMNEFDAQGPQSTVAVPDSLVGIYFGNGLFLDSQGNLSLLPMGLWADHWKQDVRYEAVFGENLWLSAKTTTLGVTRTSQGYTVDHPAVFGREQAKINPQLRVFTALNYQVDKQSDSSWKETGLWQLTKPAHIYDTDASGIHITTKSFLSESAVYYTLDEQGVKASDDSFSIVVAADHWTIHWNDLEWRLYVGTDKALLVDMATGATALIRQTDDGATLTSSRGDSSKVVTKP